MFKRVSNFCHSQINSDVTYNRKNLSTIVVLIPIVSLFVQDIQVTNIRACFINSPRIPDASLKQLETNFTWNAIGSLAQTIVFLASIVFTNSLLFLPLVCLACYQFKKSTIGIEDASKKLYNDNERIIDKMWKVLSRDNF